MYKGFYNLTSAMIMHGKHLDVVSNNMTNVATSGFKADRFTGSTFQNEMWSLMGNKDKSNAAELGEQSFISAPSALYTDFTQGAFDETGQNLDFAIEGEGYFAIETDDGRVYTRSGNFSLDEEGYLCLPGQGRVLSNIGEPIQLRTDQFVTDEMGGMYSYDGLISYGRIGVFTFEDEDTLEKNAQGLFTAGQDGEATLGRVHSGMLERSNVDMVQSMVEMISTQRAFQSAAEVIRIYDSMVSRITSEVGRLS